MTAASVQPQIVSWPASPALAIRLVLLIICFAISMVIVCIVISVKALKKEHFIHFRSGPTTNPSQPDCLPARHGLVLVQIKLIPCGCGFSYFYYQIWLHCQHIFWSTIDRSNERSAPRVVTTARVAS